MTYPNSSDSEMETLLSALTDALLADKNIDMIVDQYNVPRSSVDLFVNLIRRLHVTLVGVQPSTRFVHRLKQDLMGVPRQGVISRVRYLPPRIQIAAGVAVVTAFMFITRRRLISDAQEPQEIPILH